MTNYCQSRVKIEGSPEEIAAFVKNCLSAQNGSHELHFEGILPLPPILKGVHRHISSKLGGSFSDAWSSGVVGMEALKRAPLTASEGFPGIQSVLGSAQAKAIGLKSYDDLDRWLGLNDPQSLDLGRKCRAAYEATGYCFEGDWVMDKWGCDPDRVDYHQENLSATAYEAAFASPWCTPEGVFREIARRHPALTIRCAALEEGNEYTFLLTATNGVINEERPAVTDALINELEGAGAREDRAKQERSFYQQSATLREQPLRHIRHWWNEARLKRALVGYPVYDPPHRGVEMTMSEQDARENYEFFLAQKADRVAGLRRFLQPFGVSLDFTEQTKHALDKWLAAHAAFLYVAEDGPSFLTHDPSWIGARSGLNVMFDLAIYLGDFAIHESPALRWEMDARTEPGRTRTDRQFQRPLIAAATAVLSFPRDVIYDMYNLCHSQCEASYMWQKGRYRYGSPRLARQFASKTLRHINLSARGDFATANEEWRKDALAR